MMADDVVCEANSVPHSGLFRHHYIRIKVNFSRRPGVVNIIQHEVADDDDENVIITMTTMI